MKKSFLLLVSTFLLSSCFGGDFPRINMDELARRLETEKDFILLDVRTHQEFAEGHIPGAICIPNQTIGKQEIPALPDKAQRIYIYCRSGNRSKQAARKLLKLGYTNIVEAGGIRQWKGAVEHPEPATMETSP